MNDKQPSTANDSKRIYFQVPEERVHLSRLRMVCLQLSDGTELWFEKQGIAEILMKKLADTLRRAEKAEATINAFRSLPDRWHREIAYPGNVSACIYDLQRLLKGT